jgi:hypothetical protein
MKSLSAMGLQAMLQGTYSAAKVYEACSRSACLPGLPSYYVARPAANRTGHARRAEILMLAC